jgi:hypothetical protein
MDISNCKQQTKKQEDVSRRKVVNKQEAGRGNSSKDSVNSGSGLDYQIYISLGLAPWWVTYSGLTQSMFKLDRVKSSSCECLSKIPVDIYSNAR